MLDIQQTRAPIEYDRCPGSMDRDNGASPQSPSRHDAVQPGVAVGRRNRALCATAWWPSLWIVHAAVCTPEYTIITRF